MRVATEGEVRIQADGQQFFAAVKKFRGLALLSHLHPILGGANDGVIDGVGRTSIIRCAGSHIDSGTPFPNQTRKDFVYLKSWVVQRAGVTYQFGARIQGQLKNSYAVLAGVAIHYGEGSGAQHNRFGG